MAEMIAKITELNEQIASMQKEFNEAEANRIIELAAKNEAIEKLRKELEESEKNVNIFHEWGSALSDDISRIRKTAKTSEHEAIKKIASLVAGISMLPQRFESSEKAEAELKARSEELATGSYAVLMEKFEEQLANVINMTISDVAPGGVTKTITDSLQKDNTSPFTESFAKQPASVQSLRRKYRLTT
jgi:chromosome segregation ATPase